MATFGKVFNLVRSTWKFDASTYPELSILGNPVASVPAHAFVLRHILIHQMKSVGKLAAQCEKADHRVAYADVPVFQEIVEEMFINTLRLAERVELSPEGLLGGVAIQLYSHQDKQLKKTRARRVRRDGHQ